MKNRRFRLQVRRQAAQAHAEAKGAVPFGSMVKFKCSCASHAERQGDDAMVLDYIGANHYKVMFGGGLIHVERTCFTF